MTDNPKADDRPVTKPAANADVSLEPTETDPTSDKTTTSTDGATSSGMNAPRK